MKAAERIKPFGARFWASLFMMLLDGIGGMLGNKAAGRDAMRRFNELRR